MVVLGLAGPAGESQADGVLGVDAGGHGGRRRGVAQVELSGELGGLQELPRLGQVGASLLERVHLVTVSRNSARGEDPAIRTPSARSSSMSRSPCAVICVSSAAESSSTSQLLPDQTLTLVDRSSTWASQAGSSASTGSGRTARRSTSLPDPPSPRAADPNSHSACGAGLQAAACARILEKSSSSPGCG